MPGFEQNGECAVIYLVCTSALFFLNMVTPGYVSRVATEYLSNIKIKKKLSKNP